MGKRCRTFASMEMRTYFHVLKPIAKILKATTGSPTYTRADDVLHFSSGDVHIRMTVRYSEYKRFRVTFRLLSPGQDEQENP